MINNTEKNGELNNLLTMIPENLEREIFEVLLQSENIKIERIISKGHRSPETGWYEQTQNEWVVVIKGDAIIEFEDKEVRMKTGSYINIPSLVKHKVSWTNPQLETVWLAIYY